MIHNYRPVDSWIYKGAYVRMSNNTGILKSFTTSKIGEGEYVLGCTVQPTGVNQAFPVNPWDIEPVQQSTATRIPFPEHIG